MAITVDCPGCLARLTLGDDRAGTSFNCPRCDLSITVAAADSDSIDDEDADADLALIYLLRNRRLKARNSLLLKLGVCAAFSVLTVVAVWAAIRRVSEASLVASDGNAKTPESSQVAFNGLSPTERQIVGTWAGVEFMDSASTRVKGATTCRADGTFEGVYTVDIVASGTIIVKFSGKWKLQGNMLIWKINKENWSHPEIPIMKLFRDGKFVEGMSFSEQLVSVSATNLITKDTESGRTSVCERVK